MNDKTKMLSEQATGIGGSEAPAVLGLSPWQTPLDIYLKKVGEAVEQQTTDAMYWGSRLEDIVRQEAASRLGKKVRRSNVVHRHPDHEWMLGHIDGTVVGEPSLLECKTAAHLGDEWGEEGTDQVPAHYGAQVQHYLEVTGLELAYLAVLGLARREFRIYRVPRDEQVGKLLRQREAAFWKRVQEKDPPPPMTLADATRLWNRDDGSVLEASPAVLSACERLSTIKESQKLLSEERDMMELQIKREMENATTLASPDGSILATWKAQTARRLDQKALKQMQPETWSQFSKESESRVFRLKKQTGD